MSKKKKTNGPPPTPSKPGSTLYVVATPIGNLEDITLRAIRILKEVDLVAAEDTRHTRKLLSHLGITTPLISYFKDKEASRADILIKKLQEGINIALVSDAGTPGVSDPGHILVSRARKVGFPIVAVPGPSSMTATLSVSGWPNTPLIFLGFLPSKAAERRRLLQGLVHERKNIEFFESPHRLAASLKDCLALLGDRQIFWARELTKIHETLLTGSISTILAGIPDTGVKGESVLIITGAAEEEVASHDLQDLLHHYHEQSSSLKDAVQQVSKTLGLPRTRIYQEALKIWQATNKK